MVKSSNPTNYRGVLMHDRYTQRDEIIDLIVQSSARESHRQIAFGLKVPVLARGDRRIDSINGKMRETHLEGDRPSA
jgi:hypothetical protein